LFNKSNPASDKVGRPENDAGGNFSRSLLYLNKNEMTQWLKEA